MLFTAGLEHAMHIGNIVCNIMVLILETPRSFDKCEVADDLLLYAKQSVSQSVGRSVSQSLNQSLSQSVSQSGLYALRRALSGRGR